MMRLIFLFCFAFTSSALAADFGLEFGFRSQSADIDSRATNNAKTNYQLGGIGHFELSGPWKVRSGLMYTQRSMEFSTAGATTDFVVSYFDVPVQALYKFEDYGGVFFGPVLALNLEKKCTISGGVDCTVEGVKSPLVPIQLGGTFKFMPQLGATLFYEMVTGEVVEHVDNARAVGVNLLFTFD